LLEILYTFLTKSIFLEAGMATTAGQYEQLICERLSTNLNRLKAEFGSERTGHVRCCSIDDLFDSELLGGILELPPLKAMLRKENLKERKYLSSNLDILSLTQQEIVKAFNSQEVANVVAKIMEKSALENDPSLYNGGITAMLPGDFMCPHLDNSHDYSRTRRRDVVLLYYFSPFWRTDYGGHLELWNDDRKAAPRRFEYRPNRLVIMETTNQSWHSITPIVGPMPRSSVTTYYYAPAVVMSRPRLTKFGAWPRQPARELLFKSEFALRSVAAKILPRRLVPNKHVYKNAIDNPNSISS
jgi:Rps23 Pro-64 3,4-dihydroxylase Tpa1-like proline 4-hydroxylase